MTAAPATSSTIERTASSSSGRNRPAARPAISTSTPPAPNSKTGPSLVSHWRPPNASVWPPTIACTATASGTACCRAIARSSSTAAPSPARGTPTRTAPSSVRWGTSASFTTRWSPKPSMSGWSTSPASITTQGATATPAAATRAMASPNPTIGPAALGTSVGGTDGASSTGARGPRGASRPRVSTARYRDCTPRVNSRPRSRHSATHAPTPVASTGLTTNGMSARAAALANGPSSVRLQPSSPSPVHHPRTSASTAPA